ncbi:unnamed protein product [marine sediment metagenome]|uniref:Uncharacterized protein n=1 Tax=marine sediment metagenome TaxID=412755 RepID=X1E5V5_9ZZZZ
MDNEIRQILDNQLIMLRNIDDKGADTPLQPYLNENIIKTDKLLSPSKDPTIQEQTDKSMNRVIKAGQDCPRCGVKRVRQKELEYHNSGRCIPRSKKVKVEK